MQPSTQAGLKEEEGGERGMMLSPLFRGLINLFARLPPPPPPPPKTKEKSQEDTSHTVPFLSLLTVLSPLFLCARRRYEEVCRWAGRGRRQTNDLFPDVDSFFPGRLFCHQDPRAAAAARKAQSDYSATAIRVTAYMSAKEMGWRPRSHTREGEEGGDCKSFSVILRGGSPILSSLSLFHFPSL